MFREIGSLADVREYVKTHDEAIAVAWQDMLIDVDEFGEEYTLEDFLEEADMQIMWSFIGFVAIYGC